MVDFHPALLFQEGLSQYLWNGRSTFKIEENRLELIFFNRWLLPQIRNVHFWSFFWQKFTQNWPNMQILSSERTHLDPKLKNNCGHDLTNKKTNCAFPNLIESLKLVLNFCTILKLRPWSALFEAALTERSLMWRRSYQWGVVSDAEHQLFLSPNFTGTI